MVKSFFALAVIIICGICSSCQNNDIIYDISPVEVNIMLTDEEGQNMLSPDVEGSWYGSDISMTYDGEAYDAQWENDLQSTTRYYLAIFHGLRCCQKFIEVDGQWKPDFSTNYLSFGEFQGEKNRDYDMTLRIEELDADYRIEVHNRCVWKNGKPKIDREIKLNGEPVTNSMLRITVPRRR